MTRPPTAAAATLAVLAGLCGSCECGSHLRAPSDAAVDAPDAGPFVCGSPIAPRFSDGLCTPERDAECQRWAQSLTPVGTAVSICFQSRFGAGAFCVSGNTACTDFGRCRCTAEAGCSASEVCVIEPAGSAARCTMVCLQEEPGP